MAAKTKKLETAYQLAREQYAALGVDTEAALQRLATLSISLHCWQGDDVGGFESAGETLGGGLAVTGNYPGKARTPQELRQDAEMVFSLLPGRHRFNLHASYGEFPAGKKVDRNEIAPQHFAGWIAWAKGLGIGLDFNPTCFGHPLAASGFTLSHPDPAVRQFWIEHCQLCREIGAAMGRALKTPCVTNVWIPDGMKDLPADRKGPRERLAAALDAIFKKPLNPKHNLDAVEGKLFGIGAESYTVGMHEFYLAYAVKNKKLLTLDSGHYHPTESMADKISSVMLFVDEILLHVSRGVRWDSDHVVILNDELLSIAQELVRGNFLHRAHLGLDFFDASINRVAAWTMGARNFLRALLYALLEPYQTYQELELAGDYTARLALMEEAKTLPFGAVWDYHCLRHNVPVGGEWLAEVKRYEREVLSRRQ
ncbi:L-rhamnose isomerase [Fontisphaera persica]|uniref:L-rhamnose isomerase n=1 Tax=Fontisphaera persica TaxID=2974023 RepID=UPI0024C0777D|nr:L-rhamnose isomerase [Fontisphaera persica]WCJ58354.1 L-rhamnose isomerase [Fontisphaera persica]